MKASLKIVFLSLLFLTSAIYLKAQEKYDYAIVKFVSPVYVGHTGLFVSISGKQFEQVENKKGRSWQGSQRLHSIVDLCSKNDRRWMESY